jgi:hypothetical protein
MAATLPAALDAVRRDMSAPDAAPEQDSSSSYDCFAQYEMSVLSAVQQQHTVPVAGTVVLDTSTALAQLMKIGLERAWARNLH